MSYPQSDSDGAVVSGLNFFRLNTKLVSPGDIYESKVGATAVVMGPDSDLSLVQMNYFDDTRSVAQGGAFPNGAASSFISQAMITPQRGFTAGVAARNDAAGLYQPSKRPGRILLSSANLYNPTFTPILSPVDFTHFEPPVLDVIQYFSEVPNVLPQRGDKEFDYQYFLPHASFGAITTFGIVVPYYGRKYASLDIVNQSATFDLTIGFYGIDYVIGGGTSAARETQLRAPLPIGVDAQLRQVVKASTDGMFDALLVTIGLGSATQQSKTPIKIRVSDDEV
jgi:hypothetical protein